MSWVMLGRAVDRRFNPARCNAAQSIAACTAQPEDTVDPDPVRGGLAGALRQALEPAHIPVWLSSRD